MNERKIYQAKPSRQVAAEVNALVAQHSNPRVVLSDLCMRPTGLLNLGQRLARLGRGLQLQVELRAGARPREILALWEAGLTLAHTGVEGFSTSYLRRMGKGTTVIQNLELLKTCAELEIGNPFGLVSEFPGSTAAEVAESVENIERYAMAYPPPGPISEFDLAAGSTVDLCRKEFGVVAVRNHSRYTEFIPADVCGRLVLPVRDWDYAPEGQPADWTPLLDACRRWRELHEEVRAKALQEGRTPHKILQYLDGCDFLEITDCRRVPRRLTLTRTAREVYMECMEVRPFAELEEHFAGRIDAGRIRKILDRCVDEWIMFTEDGKYLSLAVASRPDIAARRIRERRHSRRKQMQHN